MEIGRNYPVEIGAMGDLKIGLGQILEEVKSFVRRVEIILNYVPESQEPKQTSNSPTSRFQATAVSR